MYATTNAVPAEDEDDEAEAAAIVVEEEGTADNDDDDDDGDAVGMYTGYSRMGEKIRMSAPK